MAYNQACILIQNCIGIGTDVPLNRLSINTDATRLPAVGALASTNAGVIIAGSDGGLELFSQDDNTTWGHYLTMKRFNDSTGNLIAGFGFGTFTNTGNPGSNTFDALGISYGTNVYPQDNTQLLTIKTSGNVGINTTSPDTLLHIRNCVNGGTNNFLLTLQNTCTVADARAGIAFLDNSNTAGSGGVSGASIQVANNGIDGTGHLLFSSLLNGAVTERMRINSGGCVGIGTTSPDARLTVSAPSANVIVANIKSTTGNNLFNFISNDTPGHAILDMGRCTESGTFAAGFIRLRTDGNSWIQGGNVGINTTVPSTKLHICNSVNQAYTPTAYNSDLHALHIQFCDQNQRAGLIRFTSHGNLENSFGVVQMGCATGAGCGQGDFVFQAYRTAGGSLYCELMRITNQGCVYFNGGGNVGIGTSSPSQLLHVVNTSVDAEKGIIVANNNAGTSAHASLRIDGYAGSYIDFYRNTGFRWRFQRIAFSDDFKITADTGNGGAGDVMYFDYDTGRVGMRVTSPNHTLSLDGNVGIVGYNWKLQSDGDGNWGFGLCNSGTTYYTYLTYAADATADRRGGIFNVAGNNWIAYGNCTNNFIVTNCVGVATTTPTYRLHVNGTFYAAGSSIKYKEGICNYDTNSCLFMCLKPVTYQYKDEWKHLGKELKSDIQIGLIAEDVAEVMPELAVLVNEEDEKVVRNVDYEKLSIVLLAEVQKLRREVDTLKNN